MAKMGTQGHDGRDSHTTLKCQGMPKHRINTGDFFAACAVTATVVVATMLLVWSVFTPRLTSSEPEQAVVEQATPLAAEIIPMSLTDESALTLGPEPKVLAASADTKVNSCSLRFLFAPTVTPVDAGGVISYEASITNAGTAPCRSVSYSVYYAENESFISATPNPTASNYYWNIGDLPTGKTYRARIDTRAMYGDDVISESCASARNAQDACVVSVTAVAKHQEPAQDAIYPAATNSASKESGVWLWRSPITMSTAEAEEMLSSVQNNNFNALYITIDDYVDIASLPAGSVKNSRTQAYLSSLNRVIVGASARGIAVDVVGGGPDWAISSNRWKGYALIEFVGNYNRQYPQAKIRSLQYDVEPYILSTYESNKASVLRNYVSFIDESMLRMQGVDAAFAIVIPHFYDSAQQWTPQIDYGGQQAYAFTHLLNVMQKKPGSRIIIMSYRDYFYGDNGVEELSVPELVEATQSNVGVIIAQEVGDVEPGYVTFYGQERASFEAAVETIYSEFSQYSSFYGVATHYLDPYLQLE